MGRDSGYQYKLQNADLGFVLLIKNFNAKLENIGPHLKIEVSPHAIDALSPERLQERMDYYAAAVMTHRERNQCAVHLALDLQGWKPPVDLVARLPIISGLNQIAGAVLGLCQALLFIWLASFVLTIFSTTPWARAAFAQIEASPFLTFLYQNNILAKLAISILYRL